MSEYEHPVLRITLEHIIEMQDWSALELDTFRQATAGREVELPENIPFYVGTDGMSLLSHEYCSDDDTWERVNAYNLVRTYELEGALRDALRRTDTRITAIIHLRKEREWPFFWRKRVKKTFSLFIKDRPPSNVYQVIGLHIPTIQEVERVLQAFLVPLKRLADGSTVAPAWQIPAALQVSGHFLHSFAGVPLSTLSIEELCAVAGELAYRLDVVEKRFEEIQVKELTVDSKITGELHYPFGTQRLSEMFIENAAKEAGVAYSYIGIPFENMTRRELIAVCQHLSIMTKRGR